MTIDKRSEITLPMPLVSVGLSALTAILIAWGSISYLKNQAETNKMNIENLRKEKIDRNEFNLVIKKLDDIEKKLDGHISLK
jgi:hypothetical protein